MEWGWISVDGADGAAPKQLPDAPDFLLDYVTRAERCVTLKTNSPQVGKDIFRFHFRTSVFRMQLITFSTSSVKKKREPACLCALEDGLKNDGEVWENVEPIQVQL
jgi:hypothetical protein